LHQQGLTRIIRVPMIGQSLAKKLRSGECVYGTSTPHPPRHAGRDYRLTDVHDFVAKEILA
jgi:ribosome-interacting GTPase 1